MTEDVHQSDEQRRKILFILIDACGVNKGWKRFLGTRDKKREPELSLKKEGRTAPEGKRIQCLFIFKEPVG